MGIKVSFTNKGVSMFVVGTMEQYFSKALLLFNPRGTKRSLLPFLLTITYIHRSCRRAAFLLRKKFFKIPVDKDIFYDMI